MLGGENMCIDDNIPLSYAYSVANDKDSSIELKNLMNALYMYSEMARKVKDN